MSFPHFLKSAHFAFKISDIQTQIKEKLISFQFESFQMHYFPHSLWIASFNKKNQNGNESVIA